MEITGKNIYDLLVARGYGDVITETVLTEVINDINEQTVFEKKMLEKEKNDRVLKAIEILKVNNIKKLEICRFGIYYQYEVAGEKIDTYVLDDSDLDEDVYNELYDLLKFIDEYYIYNTLGYDDEGQNTLVLTHDGFIVENFRI